MRHSHDKKMYTLHGFCINCVAVMESEHKRNGTYEEYIKTFVKRNITTDIDDTKQFIEEFASSKVDTFVTEQGDVEENTGDVNKEKIIENWTKELEDMKQFLAI